MKYYAFISYSSNDSQFVEFLHQELQKFHYPENLVAPENRPEDPVRVRPIFRDRTDLSFHSDYPEELRKALEQSRYLLVVCSRNSAFPVSPDLKHWVDYEVRYFLKFHQDVRRIIPIILGEDGNSKENPFWLSPALLEHGKEVLRRNCPKISYVSGEGEDSFLWNKCVVEVLAAMLKIRQLDVRDYIIEQEQRQRKGMQEALSFVKKALFMVNPYSNGNKAITVMEAIETAAGSSWEEVESWEVRAKIGCLLSELYVSWGNYGKAREIITRSMLMIGNMNSAGSSMIRYELNNGMGQLEMYMGNYEEARRIYLSMLQADEATYREKGALYYNMGESYLWEDNYDEAKRYFKSSLKYTLYLKDEFPEELAMAYRNLGITHTKMQEYVLAFKELKKALRLLRKAFGKRKHPLVAMVLDSVQDLLCSAGKTGSALKYAEEALEIQKKLLLKDDLNLAAAFLNLGKIYFELSCLPESLHHFRKALKICSSCKGKHKIKGYALSSLGEYYWKEDKLDMALSFFKKAFRNFPAGSLDSASSLYDIGRCRLALSFFNKTTLNYLTAARDILMKQKSPEACFKLACCHYYLGEFDVAAEKMEESASHYGNAFALLVKNEKKYSPETEMVLLSLEEVYAALKNRRKLRMVYSHLMALYEKQKDRREDVIVLKNKLNLLEEKKL